MLPKSSSATGEKYRIENVVSGMTQCLTLNVSDGDDGGQEPRLLPVRHRRSFRRSRARFE
jgi:hypothetical protein